MTHSCSSTRWILTVIVFDDSEKSIRRNPLVVSQRARRRLDASYRKQWTT
jgi:hypothetical protein